MTACAEIDAGTLLVRPIRADDAEELVRFHEGLDEHSQYLRFFTAHPHLSAGEVERFTHVDHADREAFVVMDCDGIVGVGRYDRIGSGPTAEVAFIVAQAWRGHGLATTLLHALASQARSHGITTFVAETLGCNHRMRDVFARARLPITSRFADGVVETTIAIGGAPVDGDHTGSSTATRSVR